MGRDAKGVTGGAAAEQPRCTGTPTKLTESEAKSTHCKSEPQGGALKTLLGQALKRTAASKVTINQVLPRNCVMKMATGHEGTKSQIGRHWALTTAL